MATLAPWLQSLQAALPGVTSPQVEEKLRQALREFYLQSHSWTRVLGPFNLTATVANIALSPVDANTQVAFVRGVWLQEGSVVTELSPKVFKITEARTDSRPTLYWLDPPGTLQLWPTPSETVNNVLYVDAVLTVTDAATVFPDLSVSHHFEAIQYGALAKLCMMPNKPWTDFGAASRYHQLFRRGCLELRAISDQGYIRTEAPFRFPPFA